uniref:Ig-like domain-containing protein n=1 Tax=Callorhinchus milii TaxID=7868 RepID=A0A4W3GL75_CALMI
NVSKPSPPVVILTQTSPEDITRHNQATAVCLAFGFHPDILRVKWLRDWLPITSGVVSSPSVKEDNVTFSTSSRLTVPAREWRSGAVYTCQVSHEPTHTIIVKNITSGWKLGPRDCGCFAHIPPASSTTTPTELSDHNLYQPGQIYI